MQFTAQEFEAVWLAAGRDRLPYPLRVEPVANHWDDLARQRRLAVESVRSKLTEDLLPAMHVLCEPEIRIESHGFVGAPPHTELRLYAGVREEVAALLVQQPGMAADNSGDMMLTLCSSSELSRRIVATLPEARPGRLKGIEILKADMNDEQEESFTTEARVDAMFRRPRDAFGEITVYRGPAYDNRPTSDGLAFLWVDFARDGRYFVKNDAYLKALPMGSTKMASTLDHAVRRTRESSTLVR